MGLRYRRSFRYHHHHTDPPVLQLSRGGIIGPDAYSDDAIRVLANDLTVAKGTVAVNRSRIAVEIGECAGSPFRYKALVTALVPPDPICYSNRASPGREFSLPPCGRGGIGRRTSLRC